MSQPASPGQWLAEHAAAERGILTRAGQIVARGGRSNDACLRARQYLERALGADPDALFDRTDYDHAARRLDALGRSAHSEILDGLGAVSAELAAVRPVWEQRYRAWNPGAAGHDAEAQLQAGAVVERGKPGRGIDGAWYTRAYHAISGRPAVVVTSSAHTREIVSFASTAQASSWLASRAPSATGPVSTTTGGRAATEEAVLAWLLREPAHVTAAGSMTGVWSAHLRAELFAALRWLADGKGRPDHDVISRTFERRLLRAPGWAADDIGWPEASQAHSYLTRLASTRVSESQARHAARTLSTGTTAPVPPAPVTAPAPAPLQAPPRPSPSVAGPLPRI
jgi:hypothetical protein